MTSTAMSRAKICGLRSLPDALFAAAEGAKLLGLVFMPGRPRRVEIETAKSIVAGVRASQDHPPLMVGLFADQPLDEVDNVIRACGLDLAQLCGKESLDYCSRVASRLIKVLHVDDSMAGEEAFASLEAQVQLFLEAGHLVTLDRLVEGIPGGTGHTFNWEIAARLSERGHSFLLAGGLSPDNVAQAVAKVQPWGVDVSSGVETDGVKDQAKIQSFIVNAKSHPAIGGQEPA